MMPQSPSLFRKAALDRLSSPEQLDLAMRVTSPRAWLALVALGAVVVAAVIWSVVGTIPTQVSGQGILIRTGGVFQVVSTSAGRLIAVNVKVGDAVRQGDVVARVSQDDLTEQFEIARADLAAAQKQRALAPRIGDLERAVAGLERRLASGSAVVSHANGRVVEITVDDGQLVSSGSPVLLVEPLDGTLEALLYLSAADGKKVAPGMSVRVAPATVQPEEYGYILGTVRSVSPFPATTPGMMRVLHNERLVTALSATGAPFELYATLTIDPATSSGYRWTSGTGPDVGLFSGTLANGLVTVRTQRPIDLVIPYVRSWLGL